MATMTCGENGSTVLEIVTQINTNTADIDFKYDKISPEGVAGNIMFFNLNGTVQDLGVNINGIQLTGVPA